METDELIKHIEAVAKEIEELHEKVCKLRFTNAELLMESFTLFNPEIILKLAELEEIGLQCDNYIIKSQEVKQEIDDHIKVAKEDFEKIENMKKIDFNQMKDTPI